MYIQKLHDDELDIDDDLVRRLIADQMPQWADLPLRLAEPIGTDNVMIRLGDSLAVRLPRTEDAADGMRKEQDILPRIAPHLPVQVPVAVAIGRPGPEYPLPWSVFQWIKGRNPEPGEVSREIAMQLADFVRTLRGVDTFGLKAEGPLHSYRADSIQLRDADTRRCIGECEGLLDTARTTLAWDRAQQVVAYDGPPVWMHSDIHPGNLLAREGRLAAVIDWGAMALGDPALDCIVAWTLLTPRTRPAFRAGVDVDDDTWNRGRAWALSISLVALPYYIHTNAQITSWASYAIDQVVADVLDD